MDNKSNTKVGGLLCLHYNILIMIFFISLCICSTNDAKAQYAILNHNGTTTIKQGADALTQALEKAESGDVITLSSGSYNVYQINKAVTIRGVGMGEINGNSLGNTGASIINNGGYEINIQIPEGETGEFRMEGIWINCTLNYGHIPNGMFEKCRIKNVSGCYMGSQNSKVNFINCYFEDYFSVCEFTTIVNCRLTDCSISSAGAEFVNCTISTQYPQQIGNAILKNCIIDYPGEYGGNLPDSSIASNCLWHGEYNKEGAPNSSFGLDINKNNNHIINRNASIFHEGDLYILTDEGKKYLGEDGTQIGMYGGSFPFTPVTGAPKFSVFKVADKTTPDGILNVEISLE